MRLRTAFASIVLLLAATTSQAAWKVALWIPPWSPEALTSIQNNMGSFQESNPVWYSWNSDATIATNWNAENATWRAAMTGTELLPTIQNVIGGSFAQAKVEAMLSSASSRAAHEDAIVALVNARAFDGIDIDYESIPTSSRANFTAFVQSLAAKLHASGKKLSVTVHPKTSDSQNWTGPGAQDWIAIGAAADSVRIMVYDYSWSTSAAGPITPLGWLDAVTTYAESTIPAAKIRIGLPFYGYDWTGTSGKGVSYAAAMATAAQNNATISRDANGEATFQYPNHTVFFQDAVSYARKLDVLKQKHPNIGGIVHWAAGQEDPAIWGVIRGSGATGGSGSQPAAADFSLSGPGSMVVEQGKMAPAQISLTAINGFTGSGQVTVQASSSFAGSVTLSASTISATNPVTVYVNSGASAAGTHTLTVRVTSGSILREVPVSVNVQVPAPADFGIVTAALLEVRQGDSTTSDVQLTPVNGFSSAAAVTAEAISSSFAGTVTLSSPTISPSAPVTMTVKPGLTAAGVYQIVVRVVSGSLVREQLVSVSVTAAKSKRRTAR